VQRRKWTVLGVVTALLTLGGLAVTTSASASAGCAVEYTVGSQWPGGFGAAVDITNLGDPVTGWSLAFTFPAGQSITQLWSGTVTQSGR
jgi:hypothetical protein